MPSPIGHALAGVAVAWSAEQLPRGAGIPRPLSIQLTLVCAALAAAPDLDLLFGSPNHRTATHSVTAVALTFIVSMVVTEWVRRGRGAAASGGGAPRALKNVGQGSCTWGIALLCTAAYASHLLLDWLGTDPSWPAGIQALWPFSARWFISGWNLFPYIERREMLSSTSIIINIKAIVGELFYVSPVVLALAWLRWRRDSGE